MKRSEHEEMERLRTAVDRLTREANALRELNLKQETTIMLLEGKNQALLEVVERAFNKGR